MKAESALTLSGWVILAALFGSAGINLISPFDTGYREFAQGGIAASAGLLILWVVFAIVLSVAKWSQLSRHFRALFCLNFVTASAIVYSIATVYYVS